MMGIRIPGTTLDVSSICLGTSDFGTKIDRDTSFALLDAFVGEGGTFVDTARTYGEWARDGEAGRSEGVIGDWLAASGKRQSVVLATKGGHPVPSAPAIPRLAPEDLVADLEASLRSLRTDQIDLYWVHRDDPRRPVGEVLETLERQVELGRIRYYAASNWSVGRLRGAQRHAAAHGLKGFVADQSFWNAAVLARQPYGDPGIFHVDSERYRYHVETGLPLVAFQSQAFGLFHRIHAGTLDRMNPDFRDFYDVAASEGRYRRMLEIMRETGLTLTQVVLGYVLSRPFSTVAVIGPRNPDQLRDSLMAADVRLSADQIGYIESARYRESAA